MQREGACVCFEPLSSGSALRAGTHNPYRVPHGRGCVRFTGAYGATEDRFHKHLNCRITHKPPLAASSRQKVPQRRSAHICRLPSQRACRPETNLPEPRAWLHCLNLHPASAATSSVSLPKVLRRGTSVATREVLPRQVLRAVGGVSLVGVGGVNPTGEKNEAV